MGGRGDIGVDTWEEFDEGGDVGTDDESGGNGGSIGWCIVSSSVEDVEGLGSLFCSFITGVFVK
jgi:hypothetical protein